MNRLLNLCLFLMFALGSTTFSDKAFSAMAKNKRTVSKTANKHQAPKMSNRKARRLLESIDGYRKSNNTPRTKCNYDSVRSGAKDCFGGDENMTQSQRCRSCMDALRAIQNLADKGCPVAHLKDSLMKDLESMKDALCNTDGGASATPQVESAFGN